MAAPKLQLTISAGELVYANLKGRGWVESTVQAVNAGGKVDLIVKSNGEKVSLNSAQPSQFHPFHSDVYDPRDADLFHVGDLHVAPLLHCLKARYEGLQQQYHKMGEMILSVNPFQAMEYNSQNERSKYLSALEKAHNANLPAHVWNIADKAYRQVVTRNQGNQSIVISGESGSGKTENTKSLIGYLGALSQQHSCNPMQKAIVDRVNDRLYVSNPILESFGNARTVRNDNSSRFGKYIKLYFDKHSGVMVGGEMVTYLLERSRIVTCSQGERCYHVFYEMLAGLTSPEKAALGLKSVTDYPHLVGGKTLTRRGVDGRELNDAEEFRTLVAAMDKMGIDNDQRQAIWMTLAFVLQLLGIRFAVNPSTDKAVIQDVEAFERTCALLGLNPRLVEQCFLVKSKSKILTTLSSQSEAEALRDSFCKALYSGVFDFLVTTVNKAIAPETSVDEAGYIGVLDIFGFENFTTNSFEQLAINFANESLANHYNRFVFKNDEEECRQEGIPVPEITFPDNSECLQMFDAPKTGIFALLDEESYFKAGTAVGYTEKLCQRYGNNKCPSFYHPKIATSTEFGIQHYACSVVYNTVGWLEKNSDPLREDARDCVRASTYGGGNRGGALVQSLLDNADVAPSEGTQVRKRTSVSSFFRQQLHQLRLELESTESNFIRCVKPNMQAVPRLIENEHVTSQLESAGVLQTIALKSQGYPTRRTHQAFAAFFHSLGRRQVVQQCMANRDFLGASRHILDLYFRVFAWPTPNFGVGHSKIFMKGNVWSTLERTLLRRNRMRMKRVVLPKLIMWVREFRARKQAEAVRRQQEALRALQQQQGSQPLAQIGAEKLHWFDELCRLFSTIDAGIIYDICGYVPTKRQAISSLSEIRAQELDKHLPIAFQELMAKVQLREEILKLMVSRQIDTIQALHGLTEQNLVEFGLTENEKRRLRTAIVQQESAAVRNRRLLDSGTGEVGGLSDEEMMNLAAAAAANRGATDKVAGIAAVLGCTTLVAAQALRQAGGNESKAASLIMEGMIQTTSNAQQTTYAAPAAVPPPPQYASPPPRPQAQQPSPMQQQQPYPPHSHLPVSRQPNYGVAAPIPQQHQQQQLPQRGFQPNWQPALDKMTKELGLPHDQSVAALVRVNGDVKAAVDYVFSQM